MSEFHGRGNALYPRSALVLVALCASSPLTISPSRAAPAFPSFLPAPSADDTSTLRAHLLSKIPPDLKRKWRKYGQWDYKQQGSAYRDFTLFNFGATGAAAGLSQEFLTELNQALKPNQEDFDELSRLGLETNFNRNARAFDQLRAMAEQDTRLIRIEPDFTWLSDSSDWPRQDIGIAESRWDIYRSFFKTLSTPEGVVRTEDFRGAIFLIAHSYGLCTSGSGAGYVYSTVPLNSTPRPPADVLSDEARNNPDKHYAYAFKQIDANWYTFWEVDW